MTDKDTRKNDKKKTEKRRETPYDVRIRGTLLQRPPEPPREPRPPTKQEMKGNNEAMFKTGRLLVQRLFEVLGSFAEDLADENRGKVGHPYEVPTPVIEWATDFMSHTDSDIRFTAGLTTGFLEHFGLGSISYSRLHERFIELSEAENGTVEENEERYGRGVYAVFAEPETGDRERDIGDDASGLATTSANRWRMRKWGTGPKERGWYHFHQMTDLDDGSMRCSALTSSSVGDVTMLKPMYQRLKQTGTRIKRFFGDGAYGNSDEVWRYLTTENGEEFVTSFKRNTRPTNNGCPARGEQARLWCSMTYREYSETTGYSKRWKSEGGFSDFKEVFPETVRATSIKGAVAVVWGRVKAFNRYKRTRAKIVGTTGNGVVIGRFRSEGIES